MRDYTISDHSALYYNIVYNVSDYSVSYYNISDYNGSYYNEILQCLQA